MGRKTLWGHVTTTSTIEEVRETTKNCFRFLGGTIEDVSKGTVKGIHIANGTQGVSFAYSAKFDTYIVVSSPKQDTYEIEVLIKWRWNWFSWLCFLFGFELLVPWIVPILFFFINPTHSYQEAIDRIQTSLPQKVT